MELVSLGQNPFKVKITKFEITQKSESWEVETTTDEMWHTNFDGTVWKNSAPASQFVLLSSYKSF